MERLSTVHCELLRALVKAVRDGTIDEEFTVIWTFSGGAVRDNTGGVLRVPGLTKLRLDLLAQEGLLFQHAAYATDVSTSARTERRTEHESYRDCCITPAGFRAVDSNFNPSPDILVARPPVEITESLERFRRDFPDSNRLAFVMMQFGSSGAHRRIHAGICSALEPHGMVALRADDKQYHDDLYFNILTYIYGVRFGVAVFERIEEETFNPNVSLEVGYMLGLRKNICFLKDRTLKTLHTDLVSKLYRTFDPQTPEDTIPRELIAWMREKGLIFPVS